MQDKKYLLLLNDGDAAPQGQSFRERAEAKLRDERAANPPEVQPAVQEPAIATPPEQLESVQGDGYPELHDDEAAPTGDDDEGALYDETPPDDDLQPEGDEPTVDWEKRFTDTRDELLRVTEERKERDGELADMMAGSLQLQYDLEDNLGKARQYTNYYAEGITNQIMQMEQAFNSGQIDPEHMAQARQQYQALQQQKQAMDGRLEQIGKTEAEAKTRQREREAKITQVRLQRTIPDWSKAKYNEMRQEAVARGFSAEEYNEQTDYRFFEMLHDSMLLKSASDTVGDVTQRKRPKPPKGRRNATQSRDTRGRFEKSKREFHDNPNQRGRFAAMKEQQLRGERRGR